MAEVPAGAEVPAEAHDSAEVEPAGVVEAPVVEVPAGDDSAEVPVAEVPAADDSVEVEVPAGADGSVEVEVPAGDDSAEVPVAEVPAADDSAEVEVPAGAEVDAPSDDPAPAEEPKSGESPPPAATPDAVGGVDTETQTSEMPADGTGETAPGVPMATEAPVFVYQPGDILPGTISVVGANGIEADLGEGAVGVIPRAELASADEPAVGDAVEGTVIKLQTGTGRYVISPKRAARTRAWARITAAHESGEPVSGIVLSTTKGGVIVDLGVRAFLPESLVDVRRGTNLTALVGQEVQVVVIEAELLSGERAATERRGEKVVVNRKALMGKVRDEQRAQLLGSISVGQKFTGPVTAVTDFGAFVDIGGAEGLVHVSELAHRQVRKPSDVVKVGDVIDVVVKEIRGDKGKISLSRKAALPSPWVAFQNVHKVGDLVYGTVTGCAEFGAFVQVEGEGFDPIEGLVHISELSRYRVEQASDVVAVGEGVWTQILAIEPEKRRLALSLRRALEG